MIDAKAGEMATRMIIMAAIVIMAISLIVRRKDGHAKVVLRTVIRKSDALWPVSYDAKMNPETNLSAE